MASAETANHQEILSPTEFVKTLEKAADIQVDLAVGLLEVFSESTTDDNVGYELEKKQGILMRKYSPASALNIAGDTKVRESFQQIQQARKQIEQSETFTEEVKAGLLHNVDRAAEAFANKHNMLILAQIEAKWALGEQATESEITKKAASLIIEQLYNTKKDYDATIIEGPSGINIFIPTKRYNEFIQDNVNDAYIPSETSDNYYATQYRKTTVQSNRATIRVVISAADQINNTVYIDHELMLHEEQHTLNNIVGKIEKARAEHIDFRFIGHEDDPNYASNILRKALVEIAGNSFNSRGNMEINKKLLDPQGDYNFSGILNESQETVDQYIQIVTSATEALDQLTYYYNPNSAEKNLRENKLAGRSKALAVLEKFPINDWEKLAAIVQKYSTNKE